MKKKYLIKVWKLGQIELLEEKIIEVENDNWKGLVLHQPGTRATAEEIDETTNIRTDIQSPGNEG
jgi:nitrogen fixation protein|tara:strand:+ start:119 stop:313 length:195 start_codon:yes stop_codon:yes gene_type:complete